MGQPARKEQEETYSTAASNLTQERMAGKLGLAGGGGEGKGLVCIPDTWGWFCSLKGWFMQLSTQSNLQIAFYNKNAKFSIYFWVLFFFFFLSSYLKWTFLSTFIKKERIFEYSLGVEVIISNYIVTFHFESHLCQICLMKLNQIMTSIYTIMSFNFISWWKQNPISCSSPKTMDITLHWLCAWIGAATQSVMNQYFQIDIFLYLYNSLKRLCPYS